MKALNSLYFFLIMSYTLQAQFQVNLPANKNKFQNPIFSGDYPDPSILLDGEDYYLTFTTNDYYPGLPIWHSKDLINWTPVTYAITKNVGSVWAPELVKHKDKYYIYFPANGTNWVVWADNIEGPWSEPIDLKVKRIDPGHVVDENGNRYLYLNHGYYVSLSDDGLSVTSEPKMVYDGWEYPDEWIAECKCLEAPKLLKHGEYYYLTTGQGGTAGPPTSHMVIAARSKSPLGPWENSPYNPIIRTERKSEQWWSKGHGTLFEDKDGAWWMIFHGYENGYYHMGRSTMLQPIEWTKDGWYKTPYGIKADKPIKRPKEKSEAVNFELSDDFSGKELSFQWQFFKDYNPERFELKDNALILKAQGESLRDAYPLLCIPPHHSYRAQVDIETEEGAKGGFTLFYDEDAFIDFSYESKEKVSLRLINNEGIVSFYYSIDDGKSWKKYHRSNDITSMNHNAYGGFLSLRLGLFAIGEGEVKFRNFEYKKME